MSKIFFKLLLLILTILVTATIFLTYFGIETSKFDTLIKNKANEVNQDVKLEFKKIKIYLKPTALNLVIKLKNPKVLIKNEEIILSKLDLFLPVTSFATSDFLLKKVEIAFYQNDIKDLAKISNIFIPRIVNKYFEKVFHKGRLEGQFIIPFEKDGSIGKDYGFSGKILKAQLNLTKNISIKNLSTEISNIRNNDEEGFNLFIKEGNIYDIEIANSTINLARKNNQIKIENLIKTKGNINFTQIKKLSKLFKFDLGHFKEMNGSINLETKINFIINKKFKINNLNYNTEGKISNFEIQTNKKKIIKYYLPEFSSKIIIKDTNVQLSSTKSNKSSEFNGMLKIKDKFDAFKIREVYDFSNKLYNIFGDFDLTNSEVKISKLNYKKENGKKSNLKFDLEYSPKSYYLINKLNFLENKTNVDLYNIKLNKNFELDDLKEIRIKTLKDEITNNDFSIKKSNKIIISGKIFDSQPLLKSLYKKSEKNLFSKKFNSGIKVNFDKSYTGTNDNVTDFSMIANISKGSFDKLSLKGNFSKTEVVEMSLYQVDKETKTIEVFSDRARPFIKNFDFINGFRGGRLEYETIISKNTSNSNLIITDFKVSKVPALAQLLSLASLQGIADTLSGEGIRFESFEMKSNSKGNVMNIEDALAMGPAVSILLDGYVDKGNIVSLRGTLVPATKLNSIIASIPVVGEILVGKKTGDGVVGVSFKMKGPPKDIKTTVNPIKTLTPRFIVRAIEKMKKKKKEEAK